MRNLDEATLLTNFGCFYRGSGLSLYNYVATERVILEIKAVECSSSVVLLAAAFVNTGVHCLTV